MDIYKEIVTMRKSGITCAIVTITEAKGSVPRDAGAKMLVKPDRSIIGTVGGGAVEKRLIEEALTALDTGEPTFVYYDLGKDLAMSCGGKVSAFIEPLISTPQMIIFGAGHIGSFFS
jgi:xanthine dehydrogenase accessory factor